MSKTKDWYMDLEEVSIENYPEEERKAFEERARRVPSYIPVEAEDDGLPF